MPSHHGLRGIGNNDTNSHQAQFGRLRFPIFSDSIQFTSIYVQLMPEIYKLTQWQGGSSHSAILLPLQVLILNNIYSLIV